MTSKARAAVETVKGGLDAADKALDLYNRGLDMIIPWQTFEETINHITSYQEHYSTEVAVMIGKIKTLLLNSRDEYFTSTQAVYEWCTVAKTPLEAYLELFVEFNEQKASAQKDIHTQCLEQRYKKNGGCPSFACS